ncbi:VOC family protein [Kitasatospora sp. NPDC048540]|uniref:VOC family protein n=1 Tax=unclassified Kitasatospora TaxID=2633591 RepID=UPI00053A6D34|nr:VOC family protein [Kitasatospora sp. MBT63]
MKITTTTPGAPCWVELGTVDPGAAKSFYAELFGWRVEEDPRAEAGGYTSLLLGDAPVAGLTPLHQPEQPTAWTVSFAVADADASAAAVTAAGGRILLEPSEVFDLGRFAVAADPAGAAFSLWQARAFNGVAVIDEPGSLGWVELTTRAVQQAKEFYPRVFAWSVTVGEMYTQWGLRGHDFGGMADMSDQFPADTPPYWMPYFAVADVDRTAERAAALGASVLLPPTDVPDGPRLAVLKDQQGAVFGVHVAGAAG